PSPFCRPRTPIDLHCNRAHLGHGQKRYDVPPVIFEAQTNVVAASHAEHPEVPRSAINEIAELAIGDGSVLVDKGNRGGLHPPMPENRLDNVHASPSGTCCAPPGRLFPAGSCPSRCPPHHALTRPA